MTSNTFFRDHIYLFITFQSYYQHDITTKAFQLETEKSWLLVLMHPSIYATLVHIVSEHLAKDANSEL